MTKPFFTPERYAAYTQAYKEKVGLNLMLSLACLAATILMLVGVIMGLSASYVERHRPVVTPEPPPEPLDFSQPAWSVAVPKWSEVRSLPNEPAQRHPLAPKVYEQSMSIGYKAYKQKDYQTALINFQRALTEKPTDRYAKEAIANTKAIIQKQRQAAEAEQDADTEEETQQ